MVPSKRSRHRYCRSRSLLAKEVKGGWGGGGEIPKYIGHHRQGLEGVSRDPRFDPKYGEGFGITQNILTGYGI